MADQNGLVPSIIWKINIGKNLTPYMPVVKADSPHKHRKYSGSQASFGTSLIGFLLKYGSITRLENIKLEIFLTKHKSITSTPNLAVDYFAND